MADGQPATPRQRSSNHAGLAPTQQATKKPHLKVGCFVAHLDGESSNSSTTEGLHRYGPRIKSGVTDEKSVDQSKNRFKIDQLNLVHDQDERAKRLELVMENMAYPFDQRSNKSDGIGASIFRKKLAHRGGLPHRASRSRCLRASRHFMAGRCGPNHAGSAPTQ